MSWYFKPLGWMEWREEGGDEVMRWESLKQYPEDPQHLGLGQGKEHFCQSDGRKTRKAVPRGGESGMSVSCFQGVKEDAQ